MIEGLSGGGVVAVSGVTTSAKEIVLSSFPPTGSPDVSHRGMLNRELGRTGVSVSGIGVSGHHLGDFPSVDDAIRMVHEAIDDGVSFFDNAWEYYNGKTETMLEESLRRLQTDHVDLWQIQARLCSMPMGSWTEPDKDRHSHGIRP